MIKILIADDQPIFRSGVKQLFLDSFEQVIVDEATDGEETLSKIGHTDYNVVILDIAMQAKNGLDIIQEIKRLTLSLPILVLSSYPENRYAVRAFRLGASGYLMKICNANELIKAVKTILSGKKYITASLAEILLCMIDKDTTKAPHERLSNREFQVMYMIVSGYSLKKIAEELKLSAKTVTTHRSRILDKMELSNNTELVIYAVKHGLVY